MPAPLDSISQQLSLTRDNRHQYLETAMLNASDAEREIMEAEARGRERRNREMILKRRIKTLAVGALIVVIVSVVAATVWMTSTTR